MECDWTFSWLPLHVHFMWGVALVGKNFLLAIAHPVVAPPFKYRGCTGRRRSDEAVIIKKADVWP